MCSITPFGLTGPHKDYKSYELTMAHGGGWAWLSPGGSDHAELPPLKAAGYQADFQGGSAAATATLAAYYRALHTGEGEHIDFSVQAYVASFLEHHFIYLLLSWSGYFALGQTPARSLGNLCLSGWPDIFSRSLKKTSGNGSGILMGNPEWGDVRTIFATCMQRTKNQDLLKPHLQDG